MIVGRGGTYGDIVCSLFLLIYFFRIGRRSIHFGDMTNVMQIHWNTSVIGTNWIKQHCDFFYDAIYVYSFWTLLIYARIVLDLTFGPPIENGSIGSGKPCENSEYQGSSSKCVCPPYINGFTVYLRLRQVYSTKIYTSTISGLHEFLRNTNNTIVLIYK